MVESVKAPLKARTFTELRNADFLGRMNVYRALNHRLWRVGVTSPRRSHELPHRTRPRERLSKERSADSKDGMSSCLLANAFGIEI